LNNSIEEPNLEKASNKEKSVVTDTEDDSFNSIEE
jgi:hypothetical protein